MSGEQTVEAIREDLACPACPGCAYNLRGLHGDVVACPECGRTCDVAALVTARWTGKWYRAPGLNRLLWPTGAAVIGVIAAFMVWVYLDVADPHRAGVSPVPAAVLVATLLVWLWLMVRTTHAFAEFGRGPALALLAHALFGGYLFGIGLFVSGLIYLISAIAVQAFDVLVAGWSVGLIVAGVGLLWAARRGEKFIAA